MTVAADGFGVATASIVMRFVPRYRVLNQVPFAPAEAGAQNLAKTLGPRFRGNERETPLPTTRGSSSCPRPFQLPHLIALQVLEKAHHRHGNLLVKLALVDLGQRAVRDHLFAGD